jgi:hypothetical protein
MAENKKIEIVWESPTHWNIKLPVEGHEFIISVDKMNFTISTPYFEYMFVDSIAKLIVQLYLENKDNPVIIEFLKFLRQPENKDELHQVQRVFRLFQKPD